VSHDTEFAMLVVLSGEVTLVSRSEQSRLTEGSSVAIPGGHAYQLLEATPDCELLDVTLPAEAVATRSTAPRYGA
jgi:mannose-6-phosphate isomerase-like protein (cupin superfamily)